MNHRDEFLKGLSLAKEVVERIDEQLKNVTTLQERGRVLADLDILIITLDQAARLVKRTVEEQLPDVRKLLPHVGNV